MEAAALTVALAGGDCESVAAAFESAAAARLTAVLLSIRTGDTRAARARRLAGAGLSLLAAPNTARFVSEAVGARFIAAWMRSLDPIDRAPFVRGLGAVAVEALRRALPSAPIFDSARRSTATYLISMTHRTLGRSPTLTEWSCLLDALALRGSLDKSVLLRAIRVVRMSARAASCLSLAAELSAR